MLQKNFSNTSIPYNIKLKQVMGYLNLNHLKIEI